MRIEKPWGYEIRWALNEKYIGKILRIEPGQKLSRQYHQQKDETVYVLDGKLELEIVTGKHKSDIQIYTPYIDCFAGNPDVKLALEQTIPLQDPRIMASDNIYYCEPYKSNFQFGKQHIIESYCEHHGVEYDKSMTGLIYTSQHKADVTKWLGDNNIGKYIMIQLSGGQSKWNYGTDVQYQNTIVTGVY